MVWKTKHSLEANLRYPSRTQTSEFTWQPLGKQTYAKPTFVLNIPTKTSKPEEEPGIPIYEVGAFPNTFSSEKGMLITRYLQSVLTLYQTLDQYQESDGEPIDMSFVNSVEEHMGLKRGERDAFRHSCYKEIHDRGGPNPTSIAVVAASQIKQGNASHLYRAVSKMGQRDLEQGDHAPEKVEETDPEENKFIKELFKMARIQNLGGIMPLGDMENYPDMADYIEHRFRELREHYPDMDYVDDFFSHMSRNDEACSENLKQRILEHMQPVHISPVTAEQILMDRIREAKNNFEKEYLWAGLWGGPVFSIGIGLPRKELDEWHISVGLKGKLPEEVSLPGEYQGFKVRYEVINKGSTDPSAALKILDRIILDEGDKTEGDWEKMVEHDRLNLKRGRNKS